MIISVNMIRLYNNNNTNNNNNSNKYMLVRFAMSPKRVWRDFCVQIELGVEIANLGGE